MAQGRHDFARLYPHSMTRRNLIDAFIWCDAFRRAPLMRSRWRSLPHDSLADGLGDHAAEANARLDVRSDHGRTQAKAARWPHKLIAD